MYIEVFNTSSCYMVTMSIIMSLLGSYTLFLEGKQLVCNKMGNICIT